MRTISARTIYDSVWHRFAHSRTWRQPPDMGDLGSSSFYHSCFVFCFDCLSRSHSSDLVQGFTSKHHLQKQPMTTMLSVACLVTMLSGTALIGIWGVNTHIGLLHYKIGIGFTLLMLIHGTKRIRVIKKTVFPNHRR